MDERESRIALVHAWQRHYGMEPRDDSKLTELFADGALGMGAQADVVARELVVTDHIYKTTLYGEVIEEFLRRVADRSAGGRRGRELLRREALP